MKSHIVGLRTIAYKVGDIKAEKQCLIQVIWKMKNHIMLEAL